MIKKEILISLKQEASKLAKESIGKGPRKLFLSVSEAGVKDIIVAEAEEELSLIEQYYMFDDQLTIQDIIDNRKLIVENDIAPHVVGYAKKVFGLCMERVECDVDVIENMLVVKYVWEVSYE